MAQDAPATLSMRDADGVRRPLRRFDPSVAQETLGVYIAMDGSWTKQKAVLKEKAVTFANQLRTRYLDRKEAWYAFTVSFMKKLEYPMPAMSLSLQEWDDILKPVLGPLFNRLGIVRNWTTMLFFASSKYYGLDVKHPYFWQHILQMEMLLGEGQRVTPTAALIRITTEDLRLEAGFPGSLTDVPLCVLQHVSTKSWIQALTIFAIKSNIVLEDPYPKLHTKRQHDIFLMEYFVQRGFREVELRCLNHCCHSMGVLLLSDIVSANGLKIIPSFYEGAHKNFRPSLAMQPPKRSLKWSLWKQALRSLCDDYLNLHSPLGEWLSAPQPCDQTVYSPSLDKIFKRHNHVWIAYRRKAVRTNSRSNLGRFVIIPTTEQIFGPLPFWVGPLPQDIIRASVTTHRRELQLDSVGSHLLLPIPDQPETFRDFIDQLPTNTQWMVDELKFPDDDGEYLAQAIREGKALAVSAGSYKAQTHTATSAFLLEGPDHESHRIIGVNRIPGRPRALSSYRAELGGIAGILILVKCLCQVHKVSHGKVRIGLDNASAIAQSKDDSPLSGQAPSRDLVTEIRQLLTHLPIQCEFFWIMGHADQKVGHETYEQRLNRLCDERAKAHRVRFDYVTGPWRANERLASEGWSIHTQGMKLSSLDKQEIYEFSRDNCVRQYWEKRHNLDAEQTQLINWDCLGLALKQWPLGKRIWLAKHLSGYSATGRVMFRRKEWNHSNCPRCQAHNEDALHVIACPAASASAEWQSSLSNFELLLDKYHTSPDIRRCIVSGLSAWRQEAPVPSLPAHYSSSLHRAWQEQTHIGWHHLLNGRMSGEWLNAQQEWWNLQTLEREPSAPKWGSRVIEALLEIQWNMWEHRNHCWHDPDHPRHADLKTATDNNIQRLHREFSPDKYLSSDRHLFQRSCSAMIKRPLEDKQLWLESVRAACRRKINQTARSQRLALRQDIRSLFNKND